LFEESSPGSHTTVLPSADIASIPALSIEPVPVPVLAGSEGKAVQVTALSRE